MTRIPPATVAPAMLVATAGMLALACTGAGGHAGDVPAPSPKGAGGQAGQGAPRPVAQDPGRVTLHRLNRVEYNNTVRDLLGTRLRPADDFPADDRGHGFDNVADVLSLSPLQVELHQRAAELLIDEVLKPGAQRQAVIPCVPASGEACVRMVVRGFARRAWRRPLADDEVDRLMAVFTAAQTAGDSADAALGAALQAVLVAPHFVFRVELDPEPASSAAHALSAHELAARLSYFLWSSMPDAALFEAADSGALLDGKGLAAQVARMLKSTKAAALTDNFAGQWLFVRRLAEHDPDRTVFRTFDSPLRDAFRQETQLVFSELVSGALGIDKLLDTDFTYANDRLAQHYGLAAPGGTKVVRVPVADAPRSGLLSHGGVLMVTSYPTRTSPVQRGRWVLEQLLCAAPPDPPPGIDGLKTEKVPTGSLRQRLEQHRKEPACGACHSVMDPIGFGLENYDAVGAYRTTDGPFPVDASGKLPDGRGFSGAAELSRLIASDPRYLACVVEKLITYALGRGTEPSDAREIARLAKALAERDHKLPALAELLAGSDLFARRRGEPETTPAPQAAP